MDRPSRRLSAPVLAILLAWVPSPASAQTLTTAEPEFLVITQETVRPGHEPAHAISEAQRAAAFAQAGSTDYYLAMTSITGPTAAWFMQPWFTYADWERASARARANDGLVATLDRLAADDATRVEHRRVVEAVAMPELGHGTMPNLNLVRFWQVTTIRIRPGYEEALVSAIQTYRGVVARADPDASWRVYRVSNGLPLGTYLIISSVESFVRFDAQADSDDAVAAAMTPREREILREFSREGLWRTTANRFRLDPRMSFVSAETRALDPAFWNGRQ